MSREKGTYSTISNVGLERLLKTAEAKTAVLLLLEVRTSYRSGGATYWEIGAAVERPRRTLETALKQLIDSHEITLDGAVYRTNSDTNERQTRQLTRQEAAKPSTGEAVPHAKPESLKEEKEEKEGSKEVKEQNQELLCANAPTVDAAVEALTQNFLSLENQMLGLLPNLEHRERLFVHTWANSGHKQLVYEAVTLGGVEAWRKFVAVVRCSKKASSATFPTVLEFYRDDLRREGGPTLILETLRRALSETKNVEYAWQNYRAWLDNPAAAVATAVQVALAARPNPHAEWDAELALEEVNLREMGIIK